MWIAGLDVSRGNGREIEVRCNHKVFSSLKPQHAVLVHFLSVCGLINDVRTRWINRDPHILQLIDAVKKIDEIRAESFKGSLKEAA